MIWLIGGTSDSLKIADLLLEAGHEVLISTTTSYGSELAQSKNVHVIQRRLSKLDMEKLIKKHKISKIIDASHPYAEEVSRNAIEVSASQDVNYMRFERESVCIENARYYGTYEQMLSYLQSTDGNILLTSGSKNIDAFRMINPDRLIVRVLPVQESVRLCEAAGIRTHNIIAMRGRVSKDTNLAIMKEFDIKHMVSKDSGIAGGILEKTEAAKELNIEIHILSKPQLSYPAIFKEYKDIISNSN